MPLALLKTLNQFKTELTLDENQNVAIKPNTDVNVIGKLMEMCVQHDWPRPE